MSHAIFNRTARSSPVKEPVNYLQRLYRVCWYLPLLFPLSFWALYAYHDFGHEYSTNNSIDQSPMAFFLVGFVGMGVCILGSLAKLIWRKIPFHRIDLVFLLTGVLLSWLTLNSNSAMNWYFD